MAIGITIAVASIVGIIYGINKRNRFLVVLSGVALTHDDCSMDLFLFKSILNNLDFNKY